LQIFSDLTFQARGDTSRRLISAEEALAEARLALATERGNRSALEETAAREREARLALETQLAAALGTAQTAEARATSLERDVERLQRALDTVQSQAKELRCAADESHRKVADALALVDSACLNRDQTNLELAQAKEEVQRLEAALKTLSQEAQVQVKKEVEQVKQQCNLHVRGILKDVKRCQEVQFVNFFLFCAFLSVVKRVRLVVFTAKSLLIKCSLYIQIAFPIGKSMGCAKLFYDFCHLKIYM
jgi:chromosome segregation ATPase